jgi:Fe-S cluster assembly protein SufD
MSIITKDRDRNTKEWIKTLFHSYEEGLNGQKGQPITAFRKNAFDLLMAEEFPTRRDEDWKYTNVSPIIKEAYTFGKSSKISQSEFDQFLFEGLDAVVIAIVNGVLDTELSNMKSMPDGLKMMTVADALQNEELAGRINHLLDQKGGTAKNVFLRMNRAFAQHGYVIVSDKNAVVDKPIHFVHLNTRSEDSYFSHPQMFMIGTKGSEFSVVESYHSTNNDAKYFTNVSNYIEVEDNAHVHHYRLQFESKNAFQITNSIAIQARDSIYSNYSVDLGGKIVRNNISTEHMGPGINTYYYGAYLGMDNQHIDNQTFIDHAVPHCESNELYKGILSDKARGVFNGKVLVRQDAQKTNAYQQNASLVLSDTAVMDAKPQLEIFADDVKCSHGATIGQLDNESIFYLKSRGLSDEGAKNLLQKAFIGDVILNFRYEPIIDKILSMVDVKLSKK